MDAVMVADWAEDIGLEVTFQTCHAVRTYQIDMPMIAVIYLTLGVIFAVAVEDIDLCITLCDQVRPASGNSKSIPFFHVLVINESAFQNI